MAEVIEDHVRNHVVAVTLDPRERTEGADDLLEVVRAYLK
jgi:DNA-binding FrmR family transcriptional regulator